MKNTGKLFGIGLMGVVLMSFTAAQQPLENDNCNRLFSETNDRFEISLSRQVETEVLEINDIAFIEQDEVINLGFDTAANLPIDFDAFKGLELDLNQIIYVVEEEEIDLGFDTAQFLPVGFDAYKGMGAELNDIIFVEVEEVIEIGFDTTQYLPMGFNAYKGMELNIDDIVYIEEEEINLDFDTQAFLPANNNANTK